jgi:hypothetical protein
MGQRAFKKELQRKPGVRANTGLFYWLKDACGAFSERAGSRFVTRQQKAWLLPAKSGPVVG